MSKYKEIKTEFKNGNSLLLALKDTGYPVVSSTGLKVNSIELENHWHRTDSQKVAMKLDIEGQVQRWNDVGFAWNAETGTYQTVMDALDVGRNKDIENILTKVKQRYALHEIRRQARVKGYTVRENQMPDGTIRLVCVHQ